MYLQNAPMYHTLKVIDYQNKKTLPKLHAVWAGNFGKVYEIFVTYYLSPNLNMYLIPAKACMLCDG